MSANQTGWEEERLLSTESKPTLPELISFKTTTSTINIVKRIGIHFFELGPLLLHDDDGMMTQAITDKCYHNTAKISYEILKRWIKGEGKKPLQWSTLLKKIELSELALTCVYKLNLCNCHNTSTKSDFECQLYFIYNKLIIHSVPITQCTIFTDNIHITQPVSAFFSTYYSSGFNSHFYMLQTSSFNSCFYLQFSLLLVYSASFHHQVISSYMMLKLR